MPLESGLPTPAQPLPTKKTISEMTQQILQIAPTPFFADRGCHIRIEGIVRCLNELGYVNTVCTYHHGRDIDGVVTKRISPIKNYTQTAAGPSKYKLLADWKLLWLCFSNYRRLKPVAIHAHLHEGLMIGIVLKLMFFWRRTPLIADMQGSLTGELDSHGAFTKYPFLRLPTHFLERVLMWSANAIVCSSSHSLEKIKSEFSIDSTKISLAQDGANPSPDYNNAKIFELKEQLGIRADAVIVVYSGALLKAKGLDQLKQLISSSAKTSSGIQFLIIGYPVEELKAYLQEQNLSDTCTLTGQIDFEKLPLYLKIADIAIDPKFSDAGEGSGKMLNYLASGLPVVAFDTTNNREFLPENTKLASNDQEFSQLLKDLLENKTLLENSANASLQQFQQKYSWGVTKDQLAAAYAKALTPHKPSR